MAILLGWNPTNLNFSNIFYNIIIFITFGYGVIFRRYFWGHYNNLIQLVHVDA